MKRRKLIMNLQLFGVLSNPYSRRFMAPDTGDGVSGAAGTGEGDTSTGTGEGEDGTGDGKDGSEQTFDDVLKDKKYQSEFDKRVSKALETAKTKWETEYNQKLEEAKTEAEKLAAMTANEKAKYEAQKAKDAEEKRVAELNDNLAKREKEITTRELKITSAETLADKNLPIELVEVLHYESAESCQKSIEAIEKAWVKAQGSWQQAVEKAVNDKLRGGKPPKAGLGNENTLEAQIARAMRGQ